MGRARDIGADLVAFPELAVTGYPPEDLVFRPRFVRDNVERMQEIASVSEGIAAVFGFVDSDDHLRNAAAIASDGRLVGVYHKRRLPNYGVFDEQRYFEPGAECPVYRIGGVPVGFNVCEDIWFEEEDDPIVLQSRAGARLVVTINGSPYHAGKLREREEMVAGLASRHGVYMAYLNLCRGPGRACLRRREYGLRPRRASHSPREPVRGGAHCGRVWSWTAQALPSGRCFRSGRFAGTTSRARCTRPS